MTTHLYAVIDAEHNVIVETFATKKEAYAFAKLNNDEMEDGEPAYYVALVPSHPTV